jgi:hypothetical protein
LYSPLDFIPYPHWYNNTLKLIPLRWVCRYCFQGT